MADKRNAAGQPTLFEKQETRRDDSAAIDDAVLVLYALGDFQARGKILAERELPLDRLRGALKRAAEVYGVEELNDDRAISALNRLGARTIRVPLFVAKHPYRVIVSTALADRAQAKHREEAARLQA